ncbi:MAG: Smr/MutS family protein [Muribaculaceae bacterium]|nr:Smr/MutS family protein [Muribaculaceae bacterium]
MIYPDNFEHKIGFDTVRDLVKERCCSSLGTEHCDLMTFSDDYDTVSFKLHTTAEMQTIIASDEDLNLGAITDVTPAIAAIRIAGTYISAEDLGAVRRSLGAIADVASFFAAHRSEEGISAYPALDTIAVGITAFPDICRKIDRIIDRFGNIKDNATPELAQIRSSISAATGSMNAAMRRVLAQAVQAGYIDSDTTPSVRDGRLVIPIAPMHKRKINGIVHDESASGKTIYIEPAEIVEANNRIRELQMEERREIIRILTAVSDEMRPYIDDMLASYDIAGELDFIQAKALFANETGGHMPSLSRNPEMEWYHACHPVLLLSLQRQGKDIVPLDITLTPEHRLLIISGPNAGGKSVTLKTVGIVQYMAQCGMLPPVYENSHIGMFTDMAIDIGDDQSIENDLSTYSSHLRNMKILLAKGRGSSLVLIDEFGGGTEPQIGGAIAQAILKQFNDRCMWGVITTHYQNLKHFAEDTPGLINGSMLYDRHLMQPMFKLSIGNPGSSFAVEIARKIGLPASIIEYAEDIVGSDYINMDRYLLDIARDRRYWENKRMSIRQKEKKLENLLEQYETDAETLRQKRREIISAAKDEAKRILEGSNALIERTIHDIRKSQAEKEKTLEARRRLKEDRMRLDSESSADEPSILRKAPKAKKKKAVAPEPTDRRPISVGDTVKLDGQGIAGRVIELSGNTAIVTFGMLKTTVKTDRLRHTLSKPDSGAGKASFISAATTDNLRDRQLKFKQEIDVRGMRADEALQAVTYFMDDAIQFSAQRVRILHGTGTGALRQAIRQYLETLRGVASYHDEDVRFGGAGITVVELS